MIKSRPMFQLAMASWVVGLLPACGATSHLTAISAATDLTAPADSPLPWAGTRELGLAGASTSQAGIAMDSSHGIFLGGYVNGALDGNVLSGTGALDIFLTYYSSTGAKKWTQQFGAGAGTTTIPYGVVVDASGNVFMAGRTDGGLTPYALSGSTDGFVVKFQGSTGTKIWLRQLGVSSSVVSIRGTALDPAGNVYSVGYTNTTLPGANTKAGTTDAFVIRYDSAGLNPLTVQLGIAAAGTTGTAVVADAAGNFYVSGYTTGSLAPNTLTGAIDFFVAKYSSAGTKLWVQQLGAAAGLATAFGIALDSSGNIYVGGTTTVAFSGNTQTGTADVFLAKYTSTGALAWVKQLGATGVGSSLTAVAVDPAGNPYISGGTSGTLPTSNALAGVQDFFIAKYDETGARKWVQQLGTAPSGNDSAGISGLLFDKVGGVYASGMTVGGIDGLTPVGTTDSFIVKYNSAGVKQ